MLECWGPGHHGTKLVIVRRSYTEQTEVLVESVDDLQRYTMENVLEATLTCVVVVGLWFVSESRKPKHPNDTEVDGGLAHFVLLSPTANSITGKEASQ